MEPKFKSLHINTQAIALSIHLSAWFYARRVISGGPVPCRDAVRLEPYLLGNDNGKAMIIIIITCSRAVHSRMLFSLAMLYQKNRSFFFWRIEEKVSNLYSLNQL